MERAEREMRGTLGVFHTKLVAVSDEFLFQFCPRKYARVVAFFFLE